MTAWQIAVQGCNFFPSNILGWIYITSLDAQCCLYLIFTSSSTVLTVKTTCMWRPEGDLGYIFQSEREVTNPGLCPTVILFIYVRN